MNGIKKQLLVCLVGALLCNMVLAADSESALDIYNKITASQGQDGILDVGSIGVDMVPEGTTVPVFDASTFTTDVPADATTSTTTDTTTSTTTGTTSDSTSGTTTGTTTSTTTETTTPTYTTKEVSLTQRYNSEFNIYELSAGDRYYIYTNVENGGIVSGSFYVDIPVNVTYTVEKDGASISYTRKNSITDLGSYFFTFTLTDTDNMIKYVSTFRFRIEPPVAVEIPTYDEDQMIVPDGTIDEWTDEQWEAYLNGEMLDEDLALDADTLLEGEEPQVPEVEEEVIPEQDSALVCVYDPGSGYYVNTLRTNDFFYTSVPNGMTTNGSVMIQTGQGDIVYTLYKNGEVVEYSPGSSLKDPGAYTLLPTQESAMYWAVYNGVSEPVFSFTILGSESITNQGSVFTVPENMNIEAVYLNEEEIAIPLGRNLYLGQDGTYAITLTGDIGPQTVTFTQDTQAPRFSVDASQDNLATISYQTTDLSQCRVYLDGDLVSEGVMVYELTEPGDYVMELTDKAGNVSQETFTIEYGFNGAAIFAMFAVVVLLAAGIFVVKRLRSKVSVR